MTLYLLLFAVHKKQLLHSSDSLWFLGFQVPTKIEKVLWKFISASVLFPTNSKPLVWLRSDEGWLDTEGCWNFVHTTVRFPALFEQSHAS